MKYISFLSIFIVMSIVGCGTTPIKINFDDLNSITGPKPVTLGEKFTVGDVLTEKTSGVSIYVLPFYYIQSTVTNPMGTDEGYVEIVNSNKAGGSVNEVHFNNACLGVVLPNTKEVKNITLKFEYSGGNTNLIENGDLHNCGGFAKIQPNPTPSGVKVDVTSPGQGVLKLSGSMPEFPYKFDMINPNTQKHILFPAPPAPPLRCAAVVGGGQELWIDDLEFSQ